MGDDPVEPGFAGALGALECPASDEMAGGAIMENSREASKSGATPAGALEAAVGSMGLARSDFDVILSLPDHMRFVFRESGQDRLIANIEKVRGGWVVTDYAACDSTLDGR